MRKILSFLLICTMLLTIPIAAFATDNSKTYDFRLSANGEQALEAKTGDVLEVTLTLKRTDGAAAKDTMYAFQDAITWDNGFFNFVPGSLTMKKDVRGFERTRSGNVHDLYVNQLIIGGAEWDCENVVCSFQLKVVGASGVSTIESRDAYVCTPENDTYAQTEQSVRVTVSKQCVLTFEPGNGEAATIKTVKEGETVSLPAAPSRADYRFLNWRTDNTDYAAGAQYTVTENAVFTAVWKSTAPLTLAFDSQGGTTVAAMKVTPDSTVTLPAGPVRSGYTFLGWVAGGVEYKAGSTYTATESATFVAKWKDDNTGAVSGGTTTGGVIAADSKTEEEKPTTASAFTDVPADAYYADAVQWAVQNGITSGTSETTFSPAASCTRAQMATFLWRAAGSPTPGSKSNPFSDIKESDYFYNAVLWAVEQGITKGTSGSTFSPSDVCTRGQMACFLYRMAGSPSVTQATTFRDVTSADYFSSAVLWAAARNITVGTSTSTFSPAGVCSRGQIVTFLYRYYH